MRKKYYKFIGTRLLTFLFFLLAGLSIMLFYEKMISLSEIVAMWLVLYGGALFSCTMISILLHHKIAVLCEEEVIVFIKKYEWKGTKFPKKIENTYHIPYENIECLEYLTSGGISKFHREEPSKLCIYTKDRKGHYEVLCSPKRLFYALGKKTNAKMKRSNDIRKYMSIYVLILLFTYILRCIF